MSKSIPNIVEEWIESMDVDFIGTNMAYVDGTTSFDACSTSFAVVCGYVIVNNVEYEIASIDGNTITVNGTIPLAIELNWKLKLPFFIHGTPSQTNEELALHMKSQKVTPLAYLFEPITERFKQGDMNPIDREVDFVILFMNNYTVDQCTDDIYVKSLNAMRSLSDLFIETMEDDVALTDRDGMWYSYTTYAKHGFNYNRIGSKNGSFTNLLNQNLSGLELAIHVPLKRQDKTCC